MNPWHAFSTTQSAHIIESNATQFAYIEHFGKPLDELQAVNAKAGNTQDIITDLSHLGLLEVSGDDAKTFLQGQVTNDVMQLTGNNSQFAGYCTPKGRLLALFQVFAHKDHLHLQFNRALLEPITKRLKMYVMRSKVVIKDVSDEIIRIGVAGAGIEAKLNAFFAQDPQFTTLPQQANSLIDLSNGVILRLVGELPRYEIFTNLEQASALWSTFTSQATVAVGKPVWDYLEINAGIPDVTPATQEAFVPQMINLDALNGINFKKGCYTGQEIVARTHYLGKVKRRTLIANINSTVAPQIGEKLTGADGAEAGQLVRVAATPTGGFDVLAEVRLDSKELGGIKWQDTVIDFKEMPYIFPEK
jgi:folate-binding protein YgfZ